MSSLVVWEPRCNLIIHIYVVIDWQLSKQGIRWTVPSDFIAGSGIDPSRLRIFLVIRWEVSSFQMIADSSSIFLNVLMSCTTGVFSAWACEPLNKLCAWRLTTGSAFIKMVRLKAVVAIIFLVGLGECARDLTKCIVCKKTVTWS